MATVAGAGALAADACAREGAALPRLTAELVDGLFAVLPRGAVLADPVTTTAAVGEEQLRACVDRLLRHPVVDGVLVILTPEAEPAGDERLIRALTRGGPRRGKPVVLVRTGQRPALRLLSADHDTTVPSYAEVRAAARYLVRAAGPHRAHTVAPCAPALHAPLTRRRAQRPGPFRAPPPGGEGPTGGVPMSLTSERVGRAACHVVRAAVLAPSPHNTQPWAFAVDPHDREVEIHADHGRWLRLTDPGGREMVIACGAALLNTRLAVRSLGFRPVVDILPDVTDAALLARVAFGAHAPATPAELLLAAAMPRRHTHRGPFGPVPVAKELLGDLYEQAHTEGVALQVVDDAKQLELLAERVREAEQHNRADPRRAAELARCVGRHGVPVAACAPHPDRTLLPGRDYLAPALRRDDRVHSRGREAGTGTVVLLSTVRDGPADRLRSGQALQRVLLYAAAHGVTAAFHTQPLEVPGLRAELRARLTAGWFPQVLLRLGRAPATFVAPRRPLSEVFAHTSSPSWR
ncbi:Acg family FMN-binding oxidoreductase [Streptomyces sp. CRN 30]|uniref:Acg family FMN-binding oxidoreductase n=1 Tax=Streptomyces sp. CRN 30 TaxID=3075613 RepID=UPI002A81C216|nr:hypothetical protein [Streptomyces sp. CRN 30]